MSVIERIAPGERFAKVNRSWEGETVAIIGGGPSLTREQVEACRGLKCIVVNDAFLLAPWADVLYFADARWHGWYQNGRDGQGMPSLGLSADELRARYRDFAGLKVSISNSTHGIRDQNVLFLKNYGEYGGKANAVMSGNPECIATGSNSCYQALNIAILAGSRRILFLGLDGGPRSGKRHWFGDHPNKMDPTYEGIRQHFRNAAPWCRDNGIEVINCSPGTSIDYFRCDELANALKGKHAASVVSAETATVVSG